MTGRFLVQLLVLIDNSSFITCKTLQNCKVTHLDPVKKRQAGDSKAAATTPTSLYISRFD